MASSIQQNPRTWTAGAYAYLRDEETKTEVKAYHTTSNSLTKSFLNTSQGKTLVSAASWLFTPDRGELAFQGYFNLHWLTLLLIKARLSYLGLKYPDKKNQQVRRTNDLNASWK